jgi:hypothetical protein
MSNLLSATMRRIATQKALLGFQGFRVTTEVRPTGEPTAAGIGRQLTTGIGPGSRRTHVLQDSSVHEL